MNTRNLNFRLSEEDHARWLAAAKADGRTLTGLVKRAVEVYIGNTPSKHGLAAFAADGRYRVATPDEMRLAGRATWTQEERRIAAQPFGVVPECERAETSTEQGDDVEAKPRDFDAALADFLKEG